MAATPPLPALSVASASFFHLECSHEQLFQSEYKRSNRTKGLKILRCFPHCCPEHIDRSYCGTSLSVRVGLETRSPETASNDPPPSETLAVFARFEAVNDISLRPGECVEVAKMAAGTQSDNNLEGQWVAGTLDRPSGLVTTIRMPGTPSDDQKPLVFHLNGKPFARWYYDWESGANKAQRLTKHVLKAYMVERCAIDNDDSFTVYTSQHACMQLYRVLHVLVSPEFTVISYRRAPSEQYQTNLQDGGVNLHHRLVDPADNFDGAYSHHARMSAARSDQLRPPVVVKPDPSPQSPYEADISDLVEDKLRWEYANVSSVSISRNLALAYVFLRWAPLSMYTSFVDDVVHQVHGRLLESLGPFTNEVSKLNCFSKFLLDQTSINTGITVTSRDGVPTQLQREVETLLRVLGQATKWLYSTETRQWMSSFFLKNAGSVLDKHALRACFVVFVQELQKRLNSNVFAHSELCNLDNVAEEVIAAVYSYEYFHSRRPQVRKILSGQTFAGWRAFVAQMRETYINLSAFPSVSRALDLSFDQAHPPRNSVESDWNAEWFLDVDEAAWKSCEKEMKEEVGAVSDIKDDDSSVSLFTLFEVISQIVRLEVAIDVQTHTLYARSTQGIAGNLNYMRLVLDGKERVFSTFPNGVASGIDAGGSGDYIGEMQVDQQGRLVVYLQIFNWSTSEDGPSYHARMRIECWRSRRLCISGDILITTAPTSFMPDEVAHLGEMSLRNKRQAVDRSFVNQVRDNPPARWAAPPTAPWKELGRFRLSYVKA